MDWKARVLTVLCLVLLHAPAPAWDPCVNGSFEDAAAEGDGLGGYYGWTDENGDVEIDNWIISPGPANHGDHWLSRVRPEGGADIDVSQYLTNLAPGGIYFADFAVGGGPAALEAGIRWIPGDTTGAGIQRTAGTDGGTISETPGGWHHFGGLYFWTMQSDYTLYVYASELSPGWTCGNGVHLDGDVDGFSVEPVSSVVDWALY